MNTVVRLTESERIEGNLGWEAGVEAALKSYRTIPHAASGFSPHYLVFNQQPRIDLDRMLPTLTSTPRDLTDAERVVRHQQIAYGLARKNVCLSRVRHKQKGKTQPEGRFKVGDLVTVKDNTASKSQSPWKMGYKIVEMLSKRTARIQDLESGRKIRAVIQFLKHTQPLAILLENSNIDMTPGCSRLYLPAAEMPDLNWRCDPSTPELNEYVMDKLKEAIRDRSGDKDEQKYENKAALEESSAPSQDNKGRGRKTKEKWSDPLFKTRHTRSGRRVRPRRDNNFVYASGPLLPELKEPDFMKGRVFLVETMMTETRQSRQAQLRQASQGKAVAKGDF